MKPVFDWVLVEKIDQPERTVSGIYIPESTKKEEKIQRSRVLKIAQDLIDKYDLEGRKLPYKVGDVVITHSQIGLEIVVYNKEDKTMLIKHETIMGVEE
jgi:co-chaperonin GroES (HSP10)